MTRHYYHCHPSALGCSFWLLGASVLVAVYVVIVAAWLAWGALVLPAALVARLCGRRELANRIAGTLMWDLKALRE